MNIKAGLTVLVTCVLTVSAVSLSTNALASEEQEKIYLVQILNQLNATKLLILAAAKEESSNSRIQFHYTAYRDATGKLHHGLLDDIETIKAGIEERLNQTPEEPREVQAIDGDYLSRAKDI